MRPPAPETALDKAIEEDANRAPAQVDIHCSRRDPAGTAEDERPVQIPNAATREAFREEPGDDGKCSAEQPVPLERRVNATGAKDACWADNTPDHGCSVENTGTGAGVAVGLVRLADARDSAQSPVEDGDLDDARPNTSNDLSCKRDPRLSGERRGGPVSNGRSSGSGLDDSTVTYRNLEVVPELHILNEVQSLSHRDIAEGLEEHHGNWPPRKHITNNELGQHVETKLRVGDALDHADRDEEDNGEQERNDQRPPRQMGIPDQDGNEGQGEQDSEQSIVPPIRCVPILAHHLEMNVSILVSRQLPTFDDLGTVENDGVHDDG